jgi:hypothetical protein
VREERGNARGESLLKEREGTREERENERGERE